jgi:hypothetical protein
LLQKQAFFGNPMMIQSKNLFQKRFAELAARSVFVCAILLLFVPKTAFSQNLNYFSGKAWLLKIVNLHIFI